MTSKIIPLNPLAILALCASCWIFSSCAPTGPVVAEYMTVSPQTLSYPNPDTLHTVALTHSCSCPVTFTIIPLDTGAHWLEVAPQTIIGDTGAFPVRITRSLLVTDTSRARLQISSDSYKTLSGNTFDTLTVVAYK